MILRIMTAIAVAIPASLAGCGGEATTQRADPSVARKPAATDSTKPTEVETPSPEGDKVETARARLSKEDRALVDAQEWCVVNTEGRLGSMGAPVKLTIKGQPVFLCCAGCKRKAESTPDKTLATLEELKRKAKAAKSQKG